MSVVVLDTDAASSLLRGRAPVALAQALVGQVPAITFVTLGELTKWTVVRHWGRAVSTPCGRSSLRSSCCLVRELPLATFNVRDDADFVEHEGLELVPTE